MSKAMQLDPTTYYWSYYSMLCSDSTLHSTITIRIRLDPETP